MGKQSVLQSRHEGTGGLEQDRIAAIEEALGRLEQANEIHRQELGVPIFEDGDLERLAEMIGGLDQDSTETDLDVIEQALIAGMEEVISRLAPVEQADPEGPGITKKPRSPEDDGETKKGIKDPYPHAIEEWVNYLAKIAGGIKSRDKNKIVFGNGSVIVLPTTDYGPQQIESGDNPDSYATQGGYGIDVGTMEDKLIQAFDPLYGRLIELQQREEERQVRQATEELLQSIPDPASRQAARKLLRDVRTLDEFENKKDTIDTWLSQTHATAWEHAKKGIGFNTNNASDAPIGPEGRLPETPMEMVDYLVQAADEKFDLKSILNPTYAISGELRQDADEALLQSFDGHIPLGHDGRPVAFTPKEGLRATLQNMVKLYPSAARQYLALLQAGERGYHLVQQGETFSTGVPASQPFIFPLVTRVHPQLVLSRVGAVYPIDRPDARFYYWDDYGHKSTAGVIASTGSLLHHYGSYAMNMTEDPGEGLSASRLSFELVEATLSATAKKMSAEWSAELEARLLAYQNRDPLGQYIARMGDQIAYENNFRALDMMLDASDERTVDYGTEAPDGYTQEGWNDQLHAVVQRASDLIFMRRYREAGFLLGDPSSVTRLMRGMKSGAFQIARDQWQFANGIQVVGSVNNFYTVIKVGWWGRDYPNKAAGRYINKLLAVARGETFSDAGIVYAPFTYEVYPVLPDPDNFMKRVGIIEQSDMKVIIPENFARVNILPGVTGADW